MTIQNGQFVTAVEPAGERVAVTFNDGGRDIVDHVLLGTGYRIDLARYPFLNGDLLREVHQVNGYPALRRGCESSVPGLHFIGSTGAWTYGPLMRFVAGTPFAAAEVARFVATATRRSAGAPTSGRDHTTGSRLRPRRARVGGDYRALGVVRSLGRRGIPVWVVRSPTGDHRLAGMSRFSRCHLTCPDDEKAGCRSCWTWVNVPGWRTGRCSLAPTPQPRSSRDTTWS